MESALYSLFQIDVRNLAKSKLLICKEFHVQPSEVMKLVFFEYEYMVEDIKEIQKERESQQEAEEKQNAQLARQMKNPAANYKLPNYSQAIPKVSMPSFSMPSFK